MSRAYDGKPKTASQKVYGVSEGPGRWVRAMRNAELRPNSAGAKLYRKRCETADWVETLLRSDVISGFVVLRGYGDTHRDAKTRRLYVCSKRCAAFQLQLETGDVLEGDAIVTLLRSAAATPGIVTSQAYMRHEGNTHGQIIAIEATDLSRLERTVTCRVCGNAITPFAVEDKAAVESIAAATVASEAKHKWYVLPNGRMYAAAEITVVELTDDEHVILDNYSTDELRAVFAADFGYPFAEA